MKKLILALMSILLIWSCVREHYDDDHVPTSIKDGVFSFEYNGKRYHQYRQYDACSAGANCHSNLDTLIISGAVSGKPISRLIFAVPAERVDENGRVRLQNDEIIIITLRDTEDGKDISYQEYVHGISATIVFEDFLDAAYDEQYISGTFEIDGPKWRGKDLDVSNGFFKLWVNKVDHRYRDSKLKQLYNISFFAE